MIDLIPSTSLTINRRTLFLPFGNLPMFPSSACNSEYIPILFPQIGGVDLPAQITPNLGVLSA